MSMLAERRKKQKWSLQPRGNNWTEDTNKFGQKLLEKMGWRSGKGLGAKENGITEHIKVSYKNDSKGMGYKETEQWTEHDDNFASLLENLNTTNEEVAKVVPKVERKSLELKSQSSKARVHYHKFTRGKDLSRYSEKDLANIFGKKSLKEPKKKEKVKEVIEENKEGDDKNENYGVQTVKGGCMKDYFKKKLPNFTHVSSSGYIVGSNGVLQKPRGVEDEDDDSSGPRPSFGGGFKGWDSCQNSGHNSDNSESSRPAFGGLGYSEEPNSKKAKFSLDYKTGFSSFVKSEEDAEAVQNKQQDEIVDQASLSEQPEKKKKKKKKKHALEENENEINIEEASETTDSCSQKLKKKKEKNKTYVEPTVVDSQDDSIQNEERPKKKKKNKKQKEIGLDNPNFEENCFQNEDPSLNASNGLDNPTFNAAFFEEQASCNGEAFEVQRKVKKKRKRSQELEDSLDGTAEGNLSEVKVKSKKTRTEEIDFFAIDNPNFSQNEMDAIVDACQDSCSYQFEVKRKKSKSKKQKLLNGLDNPAEGDDLAINNSNNNDNSSMDASQNSCSNQYEVKRKKSKNKKNKLDNLNGMDNSNGDVLAIDNPNFSEKQDDSIIDGSQESSFNQFEVKRKKSKNKLEQSNGIDNPVVDEFNDKENEEQVNGSEIQCDLMLNTVIETPKLKSLLKDTSMNKTLETPESSKNKQRRKSVRFSKVNEQRIIPPKEFTEDQTLEDIRNRDELFEINSLVIQESLEEEMRKNGESCEAGFINNAFDMKSIDKTSFYESAFEKQTKKRKKKRTEGGLDNAVFDRQANTLEENVDTITKTLDSYQAEVENDINEKKDEHESLANQGLIGMPNISSEGHKKLKHATQLGFQLAQFGPPPSWINKEANLTHSKKSYHHLIVGDVIVNFKNTNLHEIEGYASKSQRVLESKKSIRFN